MHSCKSGFSNNFKAKINCKSPKLQILASNRINSISKINCTLNHLNKINIFNSGNSDSQFSSSFKKFR